MDAPSYSGKQHHDLLVGRLAPVADALAPAWCWTHGAIGFSAPSTRGGADHLDGLTPTGQATNDVLHALGDMCEGRLHQVLQWIATGRCSESAT